MANALSYEYLKSILGAPNGIPTLDDNGEIPTSQLPPSAVSPFKGEFVDETELTDEYPTAGTADCAYVEDTTSFWYWNSGLDIPAWVNQEIEETDYIALTAAEKSMVPYLVIPDTVITP